MAAGCGTNGQGTSGVEGFWKGHMIEYSITDPGEAPHSLVTERPRRILLRLEEGAGIVNGLFAQSADAVAFKQIGNGSSRHVSTRAVTGTLDGSSIRLRFSAESGYTYEIDALVKERVIAGGYVARLAIDGTERTLSGEFDIERF